MCVSKYKDKHNLHAVIQHPGSTQQYLLVSIEPSIHGAMHTESAVHFLYTSQTHFIFMIHKFASYQHEMTSFRRLKIQNVPFFPFSSHRTKSGRKTKRDRAMKSYSILDAIHIFPIIFNVCIWTKINLNRMCICGILSAMHVVQFKDNGKWVKEEEEHKNKNMYTISVVFERKPKLEYTLCYWLCPTIIMAKYMTNGEGGKERGE